jgi:hypothetical protein
MLIIFIAVNPSRGEISTFLVRIGGNSWQQATISEKQFTT